MNIIEVLNLQESTRVQSETNECFEVVFCSQSDSIKELKMVEGRCRGLTIPLTSSWTNAEFELDWDYYSEKYQVHFREFPEEILDYLQEIYQDYYLNILKFVNTQHSIYEIMEIFKGMDDYLDVSLYCDPKFNYKQMAEIRLWLKYGLIQDIEKITNESLSWKEMNDIRNQFMQEQGIEVNWEWEER